MSAPSESPTTASPSKRHALYPLTVFDKLFESTTFVTGWLVQGKIDAVKLTSALDRVAEKWRMPAGRLVSVKENDEVKWHLKIPLGTLPPNYPTYILTTSTSSLPLSHYVPIPFPQTSTSLPHSLFLHPSTPRQYTAWESTDHPLTCWHLTYFPASDNGELDYTCIGFARSHGMFDGGGAAMIVDALVAEMKGDEWEVPMLGLNEGMNVNFVEETLARESLKEKEGSPRYSLEEEKKEKIFVGYTCIDQSGLVKLVTSHMTERKSRGADRRIILMPKGALHVLVEEVRSALRLKNEEVQKVSTGDILVAWIFRTVYSSGTSPEIRVHCTNLASFRAILAPEAPEVATYPHNAFVPLPYPIFSFAELRLLSLPALTNVLADSRASLSMHHIVSAHKLLQTPCFPFPPDADDTLTISNVSASRILEADWSAVGAKRTVCGYRYQATPSDVMFTNAVYISGRLEDGTVVLDVTLNKARFDLLVGEVQRLEGRIANK